MKKSGVGRSAEGIQRNCMRARFFLSGLAALSLAVGAEAALPDAVPVPAVQAVIPSPTPGAKSQPSTPGQISGAAPDARGAPAPPQAASPGTPRAGEVEVAPIGSAASGDASAPDAADQASTINPDGTPGDPPHWLSQPNETQLLQAYPKDALRLRQSGRAVLTCDVGVDGVLSACALLRESPVGSGFGEASLRLTRWYRLDPPVKDARPQTGVKVTIPMRWLVD